MRKEAALDFPPPFQGEGRGGDGVDCGVSVSCQHQTHPHPNLPLEGEGTKSSKLAHMVVGGGGLRFYLLLSARLNKRCG